ncbi:adenosylcobinamide-GDP ribazoletransferase [Nocardioides bruguierae]|uniref:adenosylcobinamide-GDP ribazoletransferase n=1 Tax=Nocardioides bruguierae TaxID=2945102 RepID=UPI00201FEF3F|nr:adenosylcobinamide-GDP ribazoletransferase [Nocardioides bruguierae]MCL8026950.1 adenosylcobinamide-GDP ribazoletransferase [Nocardioides bruguierae]
MRDALLLAVGTLSAVPVPPPSRASLVPRLDPRVAGLAMLLAPVAVLPLGLLAALVVLVGGALGLPTPAIGLLVVAALALGTRALHWDGLSDVADGLTASYDRERSLAVMRTGTSGPAGTLATVLVVGLQAAGVAALTRAEHGWLLVGLAVLVPRCALATCCARPVPSARPEGLGAGVAGTVPVAAAVGSWTLGALLLALVALAAGPSGALGPLVVTAVAAGASVLLVRRCTARLGGITGDVLGACVEASCAIVLVGLAAVVA